jgi:hypothetical protein
LEYIEFKLWKLGILIVIAFLIGAFNLLPRLARREQEKAAKRSALAQESKQQKPDLAKLPRQPLD